MRRPDDRIRRAAACALVSAALVAPPATAATIPAFSGADGAARSVSGGRGSVAGGGIVYHVTKLNSAIDDSARNDFGTIRYGLNSANFPANVPRTIVFDVGGVFSLGRLPQPNAANGPWDPNGNGWDAQSRLTIGGSSVTLAGQSAPGAGVIFMGGGLKPQGNNNIIRNVTVAAGYGLSGWWSPGNAMPIQPGQPGSSSDPAQWFPDNTVYDAMDIAGTNLMIDHVSTLFATDESVSMNEVADNITVQYSNISQGQNYPQWDAEGGGLTGHALGSLLSAGNTGFQAAISFHHNLYAHQKARVPQMQSGNTGAYYDFRNNVFANWLGTAGSKSGTTFLNLVNNFYLAGNGGDNPIGGTNPGISNSAGGTGVISTTSSIYRVGNLLDSNKDGDANDGALLSSSGGAASPLWEGGVATYAGVTDTAAVAYGRVLDYVGSKWWERGAPDARIVNEVRTGTGKIIAWADDPWNSDPNEGVEWRTLKNTPQTLRDAGWDTEPSIGYGVGDGMPTWWELAHGLNPSTYDQNDDFDGDGYTNLEEYLNETAEWPAPQPLVYTGTTNQRYEQITNWNLIWQPSKYDEAQIQSGNVTVNSVGQHAGVLKVATNAGSNATLTISAGWIDVAQQLQVANNGQVIMNGGQLLVPAVQLSNNAQLKMTPGGTKVLKLASLVITNNAKLDVADNRLILKANNLAAVEQAIGVAYNGGGWDGPGITTSMPDATAGLTALGAATGSQLLGIAASETGLWGGQLVSGNDVLVRYTYAGDANMDGQITGDDYSAIDFAILTPGATGWYNGDFNYDGQITGDDYSAIDFNILAQGAPFPTYAGSANSIVAVPEPASAVGLLALPLLAARRRRRSCVRSSS